MQKVVKRDLLVISKTQLDEETFDFALEQLSNIIDEAELPHKLAVVSDVIDINRGKVISKPLLVARTLRETNLKAFVFICNKN
jgi:hypothetical protein